MNGLRIRIGKHRHTWTFYKETMFRGKRSIVCRRLGYWPAMNVDAARKAAMVHAAKAAQGRLEPGARAAVRLDAAMAEYIEHLREQSKRRGKPPAWAAIVASLARLHLLPAFGQFTLAELSDNPALVRDFHRDVTREAGPISANHCCRVLRACYRNVARLDHSLPVALPTSAVRFNPETPSQVSLPFDQFPAWRKAWEAIGSQTRRAYFLFCLLSGARPTEAARIKWADVDCRKRAVTIRKGKAGLDIVLPMSAPIARALKLARGADQVMVFPFCGHGQLVTADPLPAKGRALRRTYRTVAADLGVNEVLTRLLMGHSLQGVNQSYITRLALTGGEGLRSAQRRISRRIVCLLNS
ncbi:MAG: tyrosine-type recombinase/integrase [Xanthobacteraceae bacterium]